MRGIARHPLVTVLAAMSAVAGSLGCSPVDEAVPPVAGQEAASAESGQLPLVVFLVRHGEKVDDSADAALSAGGVDRADVLANTLRSAEIEHVHSSDFIRTRDTAAPTAALYGLDVELYDPRDLGALAERLRATGGRHLVVGHSNTTPAMVELLAAGPTSPIDEAGEYDRLYIVSIGPDGSTSTVMVRYGEPFQQAPSASEEASLIP